MSKFAEAFRRKRDNGLSVSESVLARQEGPLDLGFVRHRHRAEDWKAAHIRDILLEGASRGNCCAVKILFCTHDGPAALQNIARVLSVLDQDDDFAPPFSIDWSGGKIGGHLILYLFEEQELYPSVSAA